MWDDPIPSDEDVDGNAQVFQQPQPVEAPIDIAWTDGQIMRLETEWRRAQRAFAYHPAISITPLRGDPPYEYQLDYRVRTLVLDEAGNLQYVDAMSMYMSLPPGFPHQPPLVRPASGVFHPNIAWEGVYLTGGWQPNDSLVDFIARIGELLAFRTWDPESVVNTVAMDWLAENSGIAPLDTHTDFSYAAGGEPLGRIMRLGPATLEQIRRALDDMRSALVSDDQVPTADEVVDFARQTRAAVSLFLDGEVPERLREQASEFDDWCRELPASVPQWEHLRNQRSRAAATEQGATELRNASAALNVAISELEKLVPGELGHSGASAAKAIPKMEALQPHQLRLPTLARDFEQRLTFVRGLLETMKTPMPPLTIAAEGSLRRRLAAQEQAVKKAVANATRTGQAAVGEVEPLLKRSKAEVKALEQVVGWREYMDMFARARGLEKRVTDWGSAGVQAYLLSNDSGRFGPFQFEEPLELGLARVSVRNVQRGSVQVINPAGLDELGSATNGSVTIMVRDDNGPVGHASTFTLTERCDDLVVQFDFISRQTGESLKALQTTVPGATSWCGVVCNALADVHAQKGLREAHRKSVHRWKTLIIDLGMIARFKERLATYHLVMRMTHEVARMKNLIETTQVRLKESTEKISAIMSRSSRDMETDRLIIPPKHVPTYNEELRARDVAKKTLARQAALLKQIGAELSARLSAPRTCGRPEIPVLRALSPLPAEIAALEAEMSDDSLATLVSALEGQLGIQIPINSPPAPPAAQTVARPAQPTIGNAASVTNATPKQKVETREPKPPAPPIAPTKEEVPSGLPAAGERGAPFVEDEVEETTNSGPAVESGEAEGASEEEMIEGFFDDEPSAPHTP